MAPIVITENENNLLNLYNNEVKDICISLLNMIGPMCPESFFYWTDMGNKLIGMGTSKNMTGTCIYIKPLKDSVNLGFFKGTSLNNTSGLLIGTGKNLRHIKIKKFSQIDNPAIWEIVREAIGMS